MIVLDLTNDTLENENYEYHTKELYIVEGSSNEDDQKSKPKHEKFP